MISNQRHAQATPVRHYARALLCFRFSLVVLSAFVVGSFSPAKAQTLDSLTVMVTSAPGTFNLSVLPPYTSNTQPLGIYIAWGVGKGGTRLELWADFAGTTAFRSALSPAYTIAADAVEAQTTSGCTTCNAAWTPFGTITDWAGRPLGTPGAAFRIDSRSVKGNPRNDGSTTENVNLRVNLTNYYTTVGFANDYQATLTIHVQIF